MQVVIVTPARAEANNGNWHHARRWQRMLASSGIVRVVQQWPDACSDDDNVMLALHARRSWTSIDAWSKRKGQRGLAVVLTGTDLYQDIQVDEHARQSLRAASRLVVLQERGIMALPADARAKATVIHPSTTARRSVDKSSRRLRAVMVGHLREVKSPDTLFAAMRLLAGRSDIRVDHIGAPLDPELAALARATMASCAQYRWLGPLPHEATRRRIQRAHLLVHPSRLEGGAHVVMEALLGGTPVLASRVDGNIGMLGERYAGYFPWGDAGALAELLLACRVTQNQPNGLLNHLTEQARARVPLFTPDGERAALMHLVRELVR